MECRWVDPETLWRFGLESLLSIVEMVGAWCCVCYQAHGGLTVVFVFCSGIQLYVMLSPYRWFIYFLYFDFVCSRRWLMDKIGIFHANQTFMCLDPYQNEGWGWYLKTSLNPPVISYWPVQGGASFLDLIFYLHLSLPYCHVYFLQPWGHLLG